MWRQARNFELDKIYVVRAVELSSSLSCIKVYPQLLGIFANSTLKYLFKELDVLILSSTLPKKLFCRSVPSHKYKRSIVLSERLFRSFYLAREKKIFLSFLFPWGLIPKEVSNQNIGKLEGIAVKAFHRLKSSKYNLCTEIDGFYSKYSFKYQVFPRGKSKMSDDDCILVENENTDNSDAIIVFEKLNSVEIVQETGSSSINSESIERTQVLVTEGKNDELKPETEDDDVIECTYDSNKGRCALLRLDDLRQWEYTTAGKEYNSSGPQSSDKLCFTIMSYNVLSQDLLENHPHLYYDHDPNVLSWEYRSERLLEEIKCAAPDILCLQEVQKSHLESFYQPRLRELGYEGIYKKRTGNKPDGVAIYFKSSTFKLVEHLSVEFMQPILPVLNRDNVALIARLSSQKSPTLPHLCIATTHLLYNPRRIDVKLAQIQLLLAEIERMAFYKQGSPPSYYPVILTGDFNVTPKSSVYRLITAGNLWDTDVTDEMIDVLGITNNCQHVSLLTSRDSMQNQQIDRLFQISKLRIFNSDYVEELSKMEPAKDPPKEPHECSVERHRNHLSHNFILNSVYKHRNSRGKEVTTKQERWVTVDYIFYSCASREKNWDPVEGNLKLLARYGLMSKYDCDSYGPIPNLASPSDHFPLISTKN
ncbi:hypothetical protein J437_LFUL008756 [Ladona fulva]|uniref:Endonuclease/exonuclease/phosphatase domain-containing protein n=1 Tax=Ladona fulva TaxID=123851 RepID=A0A8K0K429_LADFU|nr:hypothetical protein J437_LFUL008756 [Ladona fulva]